MNANNENVNGDFDETGEQPLKKRGILGKILRDLDTEVDCEAISPEESLIAPHCHDAFCMIVKNEKTRQRVRRILFNVFGPSGLKPVGYKADPYAK